jgi:NAD(P)-dependent dehydrogenase (short-subunit alcohol dehydrogenase family)
MKNIVVTGCTRGLGRALVSQFTTAGHVVVGCGRSEQAIVELRESYPDSHFEVVDVADRTAVEKWTNIVLKKHGSPEILINNAAIINPNAPLWEVDPEDFDRLIDINIKGTYYVCHSFLPAMIEKGTGTIVNLSSGWGRSTSPEVAPYCASKFAIEGLTQALAQELPSGMAAIPLNPGIIDTDMLRSCFGTGAESYIKADEWARKAAKMILALGPQDNGRSLTV